MIDKKILVYSATAGAALAIAPASAHATIVHQTIDLTFGVGQGGIKDLTMEGTTAELTFDGSHSSYSNTFNVSQNGDNAQVPAMHTLFALNTTQYVGPATAANVNPTASYGYFYYSMGGFASGAWQTDGDIFYAGFSFEREDNATTVYGWMQVERLAPNAGKVLM